MKVAAVLLLAMVAMASAAQYSLVEPPEYVPEEPSYPAPEPEYPLEPEYPQEPTYPNPEPYPTEEPVYVPEEPEEPVYRPPYHKPSPPKPSYGGGYGAKPSYRKQKISFIMDTDPVFDYDRMHGWAKNMLSQVNTKVLANNASILESRAAPWNKKEKDFDFPVDLAISLLIKGKLLDDDYDQIGTFRGTVTFGIIDVLLELFLGDSEKDTEIIISLVLDFGKGNTIVLNGAYRLTFYDNGKLFATKINIAVIGGTGKFLAASGQTLAKYLNLSEFAGTGGHLPLTVGIVTPNFGW